MIEASWRDEIEYNELTDDGEGRKLEFSLNQLATLAYSYSLLNMAHLPLFDEITHVLVGKSSVHVPSCADDPEVNGANGVSKTDREKLD